VRYLRAACLGLRPRVLHVPSEASQREWRAVSAALGARVVGAAEEARLVPFLEESLLGWEPASDPLDGRPLRVLAPAPLTWEQGLEHLLHAVRLAADAGAACECRLAGEGPHEPALAFARRQLDLEGFVEIHPGPGRAELREHLRWADVVVDASVAASRPGWLMDAQAAGRTVVSTQGEGVAIPPRDAAALAAELVRLTGAAARAEAIERGREQADAAPRLDERLAEYRALYRRALTPGRGRSESASLEGA
jgi:glycosyltransferase involved in cell wall biosynthesis